MPLPALRRPARSRKLSTRGVEFIARFEGFVAHVYKDAAGYPTVGYGHLLRSGESFPNGVTRKQGLALLRKDAHNAANTVRSKVRVKLTQAEFDALVSFVYNVGGGAFASSTLLRRLNAGHRSEVSRELLKWDRAGGRTILGLHVRRVSESRLFVTRRYR